MWSGLPLLIVFGIAQLQATLHWVACVLIRHDQLAGAWFVLHFAVDHSVWLTRGPRNVEIAGEQFGQFVTDAYYAKLTMPPNRCSFLQLLCRLVRVPMLYGHCAVHALRSAGSLWGECSSSPLCRSYEASFER